jgi:hypothetical protein
MPFKQCLAIVALASVPFAAVAQPKQSQYQPTDANAPVSAMGYESAFKNYRASDDEGESPDKVWRPANEEMGKLGGHAGQMKDVAPPAPDSMADRAAPSDNRAAGYEHRGMHHEGRGK